MKATVIGAGYVGLVTSACLADIGNDVVCLDIDAAKIEYLNAGGVPIYEPGLQALLMANCQAMRLCFTSDVDLAMPHGDIVFIAASTPADEDGRADLKNVLAAAQSIGARMTGFTVVVTKSTVPVGTAEKLHALLNAALHVRGFAEDHASREEKGQPTFSVVSNPEFLKEGAAVADFMRPDRIVIGSSPDAAGARALTLMRQLYAPFNRHHERTLYMDLRSAEFTKYAAKRCWPPALA
jgi:UDPglucose 6-dehydrogenase